jgi:hypothetical protein
MEGRQQRREEPPPRIVLFTAEHRYFLTLTDERCGEIVDADVLAPEVPGDDQKLHPRGGASIADSRASRTPHKKNIRMPG